MPETIPLAKYLFTRLRQLNIESIHGVPGDYNLRLLDHVEPTGLMWVGNANELNAGYAADGYARIKGAGALITTFGVGELSAINAIAGAYTERAAVVHIVGTPARDSQEKRLMIHHTLGDGDYRHFAQMAVHVTCAQANLIDPQTATQQIDAALLACLVQSRPVYIEVPVDMVDVLVSAEALDTEISVPRKVPDSTLDETVSAISKKMYEAKKPLIFIDGETRALGLTDAVQTLVNITKWPTFTSAFGKGLIDMTASNVYGIYQGSFADEKTKALFEDADLILSFGPHFSTTNSYALSSIPKPEVTIAFSDGSVRMDGKVHRQASIVQTVSKLVDSVDDSKITTQETDSTIPRDKSIAFTDVSDNDILQQDKVWKVFSNILRPGDIVMGETGTAGYGVKEMPLPKHARLFTPVTWLSIGYMLPACQGAALAQKELVTSKTYHDLPEGRTILFIGDGSFQMTAQELATIIRLNLNVLVVLINNDGYTIERCIHGLNQKYNDISYWRYLKAPSLFGASEDTFTGTAKNYGELKALLSDSKLTEQEGFKMIEIYLPREDAPVGPLLNMIRTQQEIEKKKSS